MRVVEVKQGETAWLRRSRVTADGVLRFWEEENNVKSVYFSSCFSCVQQSENESIDCLGVIRLNSAEALFSFSKIILLTNDIRGRLSVLQGLRATY